MGADEDQIRRPLPRVKRDEKTRIASRDHHFCWNADVFQALDRYRGYFLSPLLHLAHYRALSIAVFTPYFLGHVHVGNDRKYLRRRTVGPRAHPDRSDEHLS